MRSGCWAVEQRSGGANKPVTSSQTEPLLAIISIRINISTELWIHWNVVFKMEIICFSHYEHGVAIPYNVQGLYFFKKKNQTTSKLLLKSFQFSQRRLMGRIATSPCHIYALARMSCFKLYWLFSPAPGIITVYYCPTCNPGGCFSYDVEKETETGMSRWVLSIQTVYLSQSGSVLRFHGPGWNHIRRVCLYI